MTGPGTTAALAPAPDQPSRDRIGTDLDTTLFVEAGAGSGKTTALVDRVLSLVTSGAAELRAVAAITFTEKAAAELRDRIRQQLEKRAEITSDPTETARCILAIDQLDSAAIGTLHSFAQRILSENPIEAGLPPRIEILDEVTSEVEFERRWATFRDRILADPDLERTLLLLFASGVKPQALRTLALEFDRNWDLVEQWVPTDAPDPPVLHDGLAPALDAVEAACASVSDCVDESDKLYVRLGEIAAYVDALRAIDDELDLLDELTGNGGLTVPSFKVRNIGAKARWQCDVGALREHVREVGEELEKAKSRVADACVARIASVLRNFTLEAARSRQAAGQLAFHDLLVLSRAMVRDREHGADVRERLHRRYQRLLLDEFQDTDPIQIEVAVRIAADRPRSDEAGDAPWFDVPVTPGQLFVVGDPKQSIYRFRRADISVFLQARGRFGAGGNLVELSANFRTGTPIIEWVNHAFARLMAEGSDVDLPVPSQPEYVDLAPVRPAPPVGPAVSVIGRTPLTEGNAAVLRAAEAGDVANAIGRAVAEGWSVGTRTGWRPARLGDITVLVPARTSLPFLEDALDAAGIPYRAESSSLVYVSRAVRDLLMALRAIDDPANHLAIVATLRSPLFACGDDDLFRFKVTERGHWNYLTTQPDTVGEGPVAAGLAYLRDLHRQRHWNTPGELLDRIARDRRLFELGFAEGRTRDVWRRLRFVTDQARAWSEATNGGLREYLQWVTRQTSEGNRVAEAVLPETDDDAVRIMTIHAAKGLEFPITVVSGMSTAPQARPALAQVAFPPTGGVAYRFGRHVTTEEFEAWKPIDEQMSFDERIRLLYVACTRAKDHLVLSLQRKVRSREPESSKRTSAELLVDGSGEWLDDLPDAVETDLPPAVIVPTTPPPAPPPFAEWEAELRAALHAASRPTTVAATALTAEGTPELGNREDDRADDEGEGPEAGAGPPGADTEPPGTGPAGAGADAEAGAEAGAEPDADVGTEAGAEPDAGPGSDATAGADPTRGRPEPVATAKGVPGQLALDLDLAGIGSAGTSVADAPPAGASPADAPSGASSSTDAPPGHGAPAYPGAADAGPVIGDPVGARPADTATPNATPNVAPDGVRSIAAEPPDGGATDLEPGDAGLRKRPQDLDLPPWLKGRYGTAVGRAVHGTLQTIDLATARDLEPAVAAQCEAEAIPDRIADVAELVRAALASPAIREAIRGAYWREVYACAPTDGGRLLEGYIDLLYRTDAGMVIVDYKTAATNDPADLARRVDGYRLQGAAYALTVEQTTGEPVTRVTFLFLTPAGAVELDLDDTRAAIDEVKHLVQLGEERLAG